MSGDVGDWRKTVLIFKELDRKGIHTWTLGCSGLCVLRARETVTAWQISGS